MNFHPQFLASLRARLFFVSLAFFILSPTFLIIPSSSHSFLSRHLVGGRPLLKSQRLPESTNFSYKPISERPGDQDEVFYPHDPGLQNFINEVFTGEKGVIRGVYAPGIFAYPIIQQPQDSDVY